MLIVKGLQEITKQQILMKYQFVPIWGNGNPTFWIGPRENIRQEFRKYLKPIDKQFIFRTQSECCKFCKDKIKLYPFPNCDADHIIPVHLGGKTTVNNMQLLCVQCHRQKSASESRQVVKIIDIDNVDVKNVYIFSDGANFEIKLPLDMVNPTEAMENEVGMSILTFKTIDRSEKEEEEYDYINMLQKFAYTG